MTTPDRDVAAIRERHVEDTNVRLFIGDGSVHVGTCAEDRQSWPCDVAVLLAATPSAEPPLDLEVPTHDHDSYMHAHGGARHIHRFRPSAEPVGPATNEHGRVDCVACGYSVLPGTWANHVLGAGHQRKAALLPTQASDSKETT